MNLSFKNWKTAIKTLFTFDLFWRLAVIEGIIVVISFAYMELMQSQMVSAFLPNQEVSAMAGEVAQLPSFSLETFPYGLVIMGLVGALIMIELGVLTVAALHLTTKNFFNGKSTNPLKTFFEDAVTLFVPFHLYLFRVIWYVIQPAVFILVPVAIVALGLQMFLEVTSDVIFAIAGAVIGCIFIYRSFRIAFCIPLYIELEGTKSRKEIFKEALELSHGNVWRIFFNGIGIGIVVGLFAGILSFVIMLAFGINFFGDPLALIVQLSEISTSANIFISILPQTLFGGIQIVFFYVLYNVMNQEKTDTVKTDEVKAL